MTRVVIATFLDHVETVGVIQDGAPEPTPEQLAAIGDALLREPYAARGVRPTVRVVERFGLLADFDGWGTAGTGYCDDDDI